MTDMFFDNRSKTQSLQKTCFRPCLWFSSKYEKDKLRDNSRYIHLFNEIDKFDDLDQDSKIKILQKFNLKVEDKVKKGKSAEFINAKRINKFIKNNYSFIAANKKLFECISYLTLSRDFLHSSRDDQYERSISIANEYFKKYQTPFKWMSSNTLYCMHQPLFYSTNSLREHAIFLCWRVVFLCLNQAMININYCEEFSSVIQNSDKRYAFNPNKKQYDATKNYLIYACFLLNQVIPCQMRQFSGNLKNQSMTSGGITIPELNPNVVSAFAKFAHGILQNSFFINVVSYFTLKMAKHVDSIDSITKILSYKNQIQTMSVDQIDFMELKKINSEAVDCILNVLFDEEKMVRLLSSLFKINHDVLMSLGHHCWNYQLDSPFHDVLNENQRFIFTTEISKFYFESYIEKMKSSKKEKTSAEIYKRMLPALYLRNFLIGSCVTIECLLCCYNIAKDDYGDDIALPKLANLAKKVEILLLPIFDREGIATEFISWILNQLTIRKTFCAKIEEIVFTPTTSADYFASGDIYTFIKVFSVQKSSTSSFDFKRSKGVLGSLFSNIFQAKPSIEEENLQSVREILSKPSTSTASPNPAEDKRILSPFDETDIYLWTVLIGLYPLINDTKSSLMPHIELGSFYQYPSEFFVPSSFPEDYKSQMFRWIQRIVEFKKSILMD